MRELARVLDADLARVGAVERLRPHRAALAVASLGEPVAHVDLVIGRIAFEVAHEGGVTPPWWRGPR